MKKRIFTMLLAFLMVVGMLPVQTFAEDGATTSAYHANINKQAQFNPDYLTGTFPIVSDPAAVTDIWHSDNQISGSVIPADLVVVILDCYVSEATDAYWYQIAAAEGYTLPEEFPENPWVFQDNISYSSGASLIILETEPEETEPEETDPEETQPIITEDTKTKGNVAASGKMSADAQLTVASGSSAKAERFAADMFEIGDDGTLNSYVYNIDLSGSFEGSITLSLSGIPSAGDNEQLYVVHLLDSAEAIAAAQDNGTIQTYTGENLAAIFSEETVVSGDADTVYYEVLSAKRNGNGNVVFSTTSFSTFIIYTVDFHYNGITFSIPGGTGILLSELFVQLEIDRDVADVTNVEFTDYNLVSVEQENGDWRLTSLALFNTTEELTIYFADGEIIRITVTDENAEYDPDKTYIINVQDLIGSSAWNVYVQKSSLPVTVHFRSKLAVPYATNLEGDTSHASLSVDSGLFQYTHAYVTIKNSAPIGYSIKLDMQATSAARVHVVEDINYSYAVGTMGGSAAANVSNVPSGGSTRLTTETNNFTVSSTTPTTTTPGYEFDKWSYTNYQGKSATVSPGGKASLITDTVFTAVWKPISYTVTFAPNGGSVSPTSATYTVESAVSLPTPTRTGYRFTGWKVTTAAGNWTNDSNYTGTSVAAGKYGNVILTAQWEPNVYKVTLNNQSAISAGTTAYWYKYNSVTNGVYYYTNSACTTALANSTITKPTKDGYTFGGYYTGTNGTGTQYINADGQCINNLYSSVAADTTLYAKWTPISYAVSFNGNGATSGSMSNQTFTYGTAQALTANAFTRQYTVTYNANGGSVGTANATATATFNGWEDRGSIVYNGTTYSYTQFDAPYYANTYGDLMNAFGYNKYSLINHYFGNGKGEGRSAVGSSAGLYPNSATVNNLSTTANYTVPLYANWTLGSVTLPTPTREGYEFKGWYSDSALTNSVGGAGASYTPTANTTLYAKWESLAKYTVTYQYNGTAPAGAPAVPGSAEYTVGDEVTVAAAPTLTGYKFSGWSTGDAAITGGKFTMPAPNVTITGIWTAQYRYVLNFDANGGGNAPATIDSGWVDGSSYTFGWTTVPTRAGYDFMGWAESAASTTNVAGSGKNAYTLTGNAAQTAEKTLYAIWQRQTGSLKLDHEGTGPAIVTVTGEGLNITLVLSEDMTIPGLPTGTYTITAAGAAATMTAAVSTPSPVISKDSTTTVKITVSGKNVNWFAGFSRVVNKVS